MQLYNLSYDERRKFHRLQACPVCRAFIEDYESFELVSFKHGRNKISTFIHTKCLIKFHKEIFHENLEGGDENEQTNKSVERIKADIS